MTTRRTTFTRTPFVISAFLAANLVAAGAPMVALAEEGTPQENEPTELILDDQGKELSTQGQESPSQGEEPPANNEESSNEGNFSTQSEEPSLRAAAECGTCIWEVKDKTLTIKPTSGDSGTLDNWGENVPWAASAKDIEKVVIEKGAKVDKAVKATTCQKMFQGCENLETLDLRYLDVTGVTNFNEMFDGCEKLKEIKFAKGFKFVFPGDDDPKFPTPGEGYTSNWSNGKKAYATSVLKDELHDKTMDEDQVWKWQKKVTPKVEVTLSSSKFVYDGAEKKPDIKDVVVKDGDETLDPSCYEITNDLKGRIDAGSTTVTVTAKDKLKGEGYYSWTEDSAKGTADFVVEPKAINFTVKNTSRAYDGYIKDEKYWAQPTYGITVDSTQFVDDDYKALKIVKLGSYKYNCDWENKVGSYPVTLSSEAIQIKDKDTTSSSSDDSTATAAETTSIAANYKVGEIKDGTLSVTAANLALAEIDPIAARTYNGSAHTPEPVIKMKYTTDNGSAYAVLTKDTDYTLSWSNNTQAGTATVTATGKGNFTGTKSTTFKINSSGTTTSSTTSSTTARSATPSTADPTTTGLMGMLAAGISALLAGRIVRKHED